MAVDLTNPIFHDDAAARAHLEAQRWPHGPECPHCGADKEGQITKLKLVKRQMCGRAKIDLLQARLLSAS